MRKLRFLISLTTDENDISWNRRNRLKTPRPSSVSPSDILYSGNDAITQSNNLLHVIQGDPKAFPDAIIFEPVGGTAMPQVARAAVNAGIGWAVLNREAPYISEFRRFSKVPILSITTDHVEVGRIAGRQCAALLPGGGSILYIEGPSHSDAAREREVGLQLTKPANIHVSTLKGQWTDDSAEKAVANWLKLPTSQKPKSIWWSRKTTSWTWARARRSRPFPRKRTANVGSRFPSLAATACPRPGRAVCAAAC